MRTKTALFLTILNVLLHTQVMAEHQPWVIDSQADWQKQAAAHTNLNFDEGLADPTARESTFRSRIKVFDTKRSARSIVFEQSAIWQNWEQVPNVGPANLQDAPVILCLGKNNYWMFGRYGKLGGKRVKGRKPPAPFKAESTKLEGFDVSLLTTPDPHQFNAPGGLKKGKGGYHAWQSRDMVNWVHHGPVTEGFSRWVTSAEYVDGKCYIYYDYPNDQDPHVYVDDDLTDGVPGKNMGIAVKDPSDGSDSGVIRDEDGRFHVIFEDWSPISANKRSWDSPLGGHAVSHNGVSDFKIIAPAVDNRTKPTGKFATYKHPHWLQHPDWKSNIARYEIHEPEQEAYGDWAAIRVGGQYYLFGDYDPVGGHQMAVGWFTSPSLDQKFTWCDKIGKGHPDPDIGFAEGKFYLITQFKQDFVSPGPWVEQVEARVGVDEDKDGTIDAWTKWQAVRETYRYKPGFAKLIDKSAASIDLTGLPEGHGFQFEFRMTDTTANKSKPMMDKITLHFGDEAKGASAAADGFKPLFNGKDLEGWEIFGDRSGWKIMPGGVLRNDRTTGNHNWIRYAGKQFSDYVLKVDWRVAKGGNSGIFLRAKPGQSPWSTGLEVQISNQPRDKKHCTGSVYGKVAVSKVPDESADRWHDFEIHCIGKRIRVIADDQVIIDADRSGDKRWPATGYVGMQDAHMNSPKGQYVEFRNILIKEISSGE